MTMDGVLDKLRSIHGVIGCGVFDVQGTCLAWGMPPPFEPVLLSKVVGQITEVAELYKSIESGSTPRHLVVRYDQGYAVARWAQQFVLLGFTTDTVNMSMVQVALNVVALRLADMGAYPSPLPGPRMPSLGPAMGALQNQIPRSGSSGSFGSMNRTNAGIDFSLSPAPPAPVVPEDAVSEAALNRLIRALARHMGPIAKILMKEEIAKLGATPKTLRKGQYEDLVALLAKKINDGQKRRQFVAEAKTAANA